MGDALLGCELSCCLLRLVLLQLIEESRQLDFQHARVHAFKIEITPSSIISPRRYSSRPDPHLACHGKQKQIGDSHSIDGRHKRHRDAATDLLNVVEVPHHLMSRAPRRECRPWAKSTADSNTAGSRSSFSVAESRTTCMILRSSAGSVPSTASITDCRRNGS